MYPHVSHREDRPILDVSHMTVRYDGRTALEDLTFHLHPGEAVAVVGPNGAGKSTLFKVVAGVLPPTAGEVSVFGSRPHMHVCIAYTPQRAQVDWNFPVTVRDVVMMGRSAKLGPFAWPKKADWENVQRALRLVELTEMADVRISELSGGQQQRMFIGRALAQEAELMLLDEPLSGLDLPSQESILALLQRLKDRGVTLMVATHDLEQAAGRFSRIMLLNRQIIAYGAPDVVLVEANLVRAYGGRLQGIAGERFLSAGGHEELPGHGHRD